MADIKGRFHSGEHSLRATDREGSTFKSPSSTPAKPGDQTIYYSEELIELYAKFKAFIEPGSVLYPGCGFDASPAKVFARVTFVDREDNNDGCIDQLLQAGHIAVKCDIRDYVPKEKHDLLILLNPGISETEWATRHLVSGGYILANNYHDSATQLHERPENFELVAVMQKLGGEFSDDTEGWFEGITVTTLLSNPEFRERWERASPEKRYKIEFKLRLERSFSPRVYRYVFRKR